MLETVSRTDPEAVGSVRRLVEHVGPTYEAGHLAPNVEYDVRAVPVPVFGADEVPPGLSLYGLPPWSSAAEFEALALRLPGSLQETHRGPDHPMLGRESGRTTD